MTRRLTFNLDGRIALVTGASSGLGRHFVRTLAAHGASVALAARRFERLEALAGEIQEAGGAAHPVRMDVTDARSVEDGLDSVQEAFGAPDLLVNNSGIARPASTLDVTGEDWAAVIGTNLEGGVAGRARDRAAHGRCRAPRGDRQRVVDPGVRGHGRARPVCRFEGGTAAAHPDHGDGARPPPGAGQRHRTGLRAHGDEPRILREQGGGRR